MNSLKFRLKIYVFTGLILFLLAIPLKCFAASKPTVSSAEAQVMREKFVAEVKKYVGCRYVLGATGPDKFDCSGLIVYSAKQSINKSLPRTAKSMYSYVKIVPDKEKEIGDLMFFKTKGDGTISHVGVYIGNNQFISALSDGNNTGVIVSSIKEGYWKPKYAAVGKFLPSGNGVNSSSGNSSQSEDGDSDESGGTVASGGGKYSAFTSTKGSKFTDNLLVDGTFTVDWSLFTTKRFMPDFRGLTAGADIYYTGYAISPGVGIQTKWNFGTKTFQIPVLFSVGFGDFVRIYAGPVFTIGTCYQPGTDDEIKPSIFPGMLGIQFQTPSLTKGKYKVHIYQDLSYSVYNNMDGAALSPLESFASGFVFNTGIRVTFPFSVFI